MTALAHPLTDPGGLGVPPLSVALAAAAVVALVAVFAPVPPAADERRGVDPLADVDAPLTPPRLVTRGLVVVLLLFSIYAARRGNPDGLNNIAPPLVVGIAWAAIVVLGCVLRRAWTWIDPWDAIARAIEPLAAAPSRAPVDDPDPEPGREIDLEPGPEIELEPDRETDLDPDAAEEDAAAPEVCRESAWPAVVAALAVVHFLVVRPDSTQPRTIGAWLAAYTIVAVAVGVGLGRRALARADVIGATARWAGELRDGLAVRWSVPAGAEAVLAVIAGGLLFDLARRSGAYLEVLEWLGVSRVASTTERTVVLSVATCCLVAVAVLHGAERVAARRGLPGAVAVATLPVVLALVVVWRLRRLLVSLQLLPIVGGDPLGRGWDLFGTRDRVLDANPFGTPAQRWFSIAVIVVAGIVGAVALRRRPGARSARDPASYVLYLLVAVSILTLATAV